MSVSAEDERRWEEMKKKDPHEVAAKIAELRHSLKINPPVNVLAATRAQFGHDYCIKGVCP